ncbi:Conserved_hypothetical protein [Hexamita inflata]|uniref:Uncharacterized protein n=1 Tax=Hexamita inflata TaxID=28002 RepID=A0AA86P1R8_9EUKA|nr:Conserved hypothetical protein [Hexamita inflata]
MSISDISDSEDNDMRNTVAEKPVSQAKKPQSNAKQFQPSFNTSGQDAQMQQQLELLQKQQQQMELLQAKVSEPAKPSSQCNPSQPPQQPKKQQQVTMAQTKPSPPRQSYGNQPPQLRELQQKIQMLEEQNAQLRQAGQDNNSQIMSNPDVSKKFVDLNSKVRQLTAGNEVLKTKADNQQKLIQQYQIEIDQLHKQLEKLTGKQFDGKPVRSEDETRLLTIIATKEVENKQLLERFGDMNMKVQVMQNENLKLKKFVQQECGTDFDKLQNNPEWKGRYEVIEVLRMQAKKKDQRIADLEKSVQDLQKPGGFDVKEFQATTEKEIKAKYIDQLNSFQSIIDEKAKTNAALAEKLEQAVEKQKRVQLRLNSFETSNVRQRESIQTLVMKSKLDDALINDFRQLVFNNKAMKDGQYKDELEQMRIQKAVLEQKLTQSLLTLQQTQQNQLQILYAGAQLELNDYKEKIQILQQERTALFKRVQELEDRRLSVIKESDDVVQIVKEMQNYSRIQIGLQVEFNKKSVAICEQFSQVLLQNGASPLPVQDLQQMEQAIQLDSQNYVTKTEQLIKSKRVKRPIEPQKQASTNSYEEYKKEVKTPKPIKSRAQSHMEEQLQQYEQSEHKQSIHEQSVHEQMSVNEPKYEEPEPEAQNSPGGYQDIYDQYKDPEVDAGNEEDIDMEAEYNKYVNQDEPPADQLSAENEGAEIPKEE